MSCDWRGRSCLRRKAAPSILRMRWVLLCLTTFLLLGSVPRAEVPPLRTDTANVRLADGFDCPVGKDATKKYYKARGYRPNGHLGEDWNGAGGGDTDLGDPVHATAHGLVLFARDYHVGWGNVVIIRHAYMEGSEVKYVDSLYGHLHEIMVAENQQVARGQLIGSIGNNRGMYDAHLHFEMRKDLRVGMYRSSFPRDFSVYWDPTSFIAAHRTLPGESRIVAVPINTFPLNAPPSYAAPTAPSLSTPAPGAPTTIIRRSPYRVDRFEDMRGSGY